MEKSKNTIPDGQVIRRGSDEGGMETGEVGVDGDSGERMGGDTTGGEETRDEEMETVRN